MRKVLAALLQGILLSLAPTSATLAHEFWLEPTSFSAEVGATLDLGLYVGQGMRGEDYPYLPRRIDAFELTLDDTTLPLASAEAAVPAARVVLSRPGLHIARYRSTGSVARYKTFSEFAHYLEHEGLTEFADRHEQRELPRSNFAERYIRHAKTLVQVGPVRSGQVDRAEGLALEWVALDNPYAAGLDVVRMQLLRAGQPLPGRRVSLFVDNGRVTHSALVTDANGIVPVPLANGGKFLLNGIDLHPVEQGEVVWLSYWASVTFGLPVRLDDLHPMDPLTAVELSRAVKVIADSGRATEATRLGMVTLAEPEKAAVLAWRPGRPLARGALALVINDNTVSEVSIDLVSGKIIAWRELEGVQPPLRSDEWARAQAITKSDSRWLAAMRMRGYDDVSRVFCESLSAGFFDDPEEQGRRLVRMPCYDIEGVQTNIYGRPIEGLVALVDLDEGRVIQVQDTGPVPVAAATQGFGEGEIERVDPPMHAVHIAAPGGWNFDVNGRGVGWQDWNFHVGFDQRFGPVLSLVTHRDEQRRRSVLYQGHLSEVFVPYMDPDEGWYYRSYMDAGEYGLGRYASPLAPGRDCPDGAAYFDADLVGAVGKAYVRERVMCLFERNSGDPLWRHWEALDGHHASRPDVELVLRTMPSVGNYDYVVDWVFTQKGEIQVNIGATGIDAVKGVAVSSMDDAGAAAQTASGMLVAPNLVAVNHDHYFAVRLDLDVDGPVNSFVRATLDRTTLPQTHPRRSLWRLARQPDGTERGYTARRGPEFWALENPTQKTALGHHPGYQIQGRGATSLLAEDDWPQRRAGFSAENLWVTTYRPGERFASGPYPNQSGTAGGVTEYVNGEQTSSTDLVAWYTMGFHHITRPEDWPVLPTVWHQVKLRPYGFFDSNPGLGIAPEFRAVHEGH
ncbi:MAG: DUF4198 domain-containing protein [Halioglobus sp.]|nr:DUF4198 domain-containing protein [Halioglobus sp.]